ncbi:MULTISPECIES: preprotein translocase subunit SecE [unclassified Eikenella]|uniref:preprotein translocase subunit SecE n=1 Tax=unclassified Eikenella TaxID=2639367 RepID=UPI0009EDCA9C|nr:MULTISPECIES: preprotein translocase subunit SecE [unclassified Eikenella]
MSDRKQKVKEMAVASLKQSRQELRDRRRGVQRKTGRENVAKLCLAAALVAGGAIGFSFLSQQPLYVRGVILGVPLLLSGLIVLFWCDASPSLIRYIKDSVVEIKKVVWPPKNEAWRNTFFVLVFTAVLTLFLWLVDSFLVWLFTQST